MLIVLDKIVSLFNSIVKKQISISGLKGNKVLFLVLFGLVIIPTGLSAQTSDMITISVDENQTDIVEGERAQFILTSNAVSLTPLTVNISVTEIGDFIVDPAPTFWPFSGNARSETYLIPTHDDATEEPIPGQIQVRVLAGTGYTFSNNNIAEVKVRDNDSVPYYTISTPQGEYNEGETIPVSISSTSIASTNQSINVALQQNGEFIDTSNSEFRTTFPDYSSTNQSLQIIIPAGQFLATFQLPTSDNNSADLDGFISLNIISQVNSQAVSEQATIEILDDDNFIVSISTTSANITEGEPANFTVTSTRSADKIRTINLNISESHDFIDGQVPNSISILEDTTSNSFSIRTVDDSTNDPETGTITVALAAGVGYSLDTSKDSVGITVSDNDPLPVVRISSLLASSQEGSRAFFNLYSDRAASFSYNINVRFTQVGNFFQTVPNGTFIPNSSNDWQIRMGVGNNSVPTYVRLLDNDIFEIDGSITATVLPGDNYEVHSDQNSFTVSIINNDSRPIASVSGSTIPDFALPSVKEGETATFTFMLTQASTIPITVNVHDA